MEEIKEAMSKNEEDKKVATQSLNFVESYKKNILMHRPKSELLSNLMEKN
jgi:hypothetical protein